MFYALAFASLGLLLPAPAAQAQSEGVRRATESASRRTNDVSSVEVVSEADGSTRLIVTGTATFRPQVSTEGDSTIVTVPGLWRAGKTGVRAVRKNGVAFVNCVQYTLKPKRVVRLVVNGMEPLAAEVRATESPLVWEVVLRTRASQPPALVRDEVPVTPVEVVKASAPIHLPAPALSAWATDAPATTEAVWGVVDFSPVVRSIGAAATLSQDTTPRPSGLLLAMPERPMSLLAPSVAIEKGSGKLAPVLVNLPTDATLPSLTAAAIAAPRPRMPEPEKPATTVAKAEPKSKPLMLAGPRKRSNEPVDVNTSMVTLDLVDTDIVSVLKAITQQSGVNVVVSPEVTGKVTVSLRKVTVLEAINQIASIARFRFKLVGQTFFVGSAADIIIATTPPGMGEYVNSSIPFFYATAAELEKSLKQSFPNVSLTLIGVSAESKSVQTDATGAAPGTPSNQTVKVTPRGGVVNVTSSVEEIRKVRDFIEATENTLLKSSIEDARIQAERARGNAVEVYRVHNSDPDGLITLMKGLAPSVIFQAGPNQNRVGESGGGSVSFGNDSGPKNNGPIKSSILILSGPPADVKSALEKLEKIDLRSPLLVFEAKLVEVNTDDKENLGLTYDLSRSVTVGEQNAGGAASLGAGATGGTGGGGSVGRLLGGGAMWRTPYSINAQINALAQNNKARILASPTLTAMDNNPAKTFIGDEIKYVSNIQQTQQGATISTEVAKAGITLQVVGRTRPDGEIELMVHPEVSVIKSFLQLPNGVALPQIATRYVDTMVRVKDGETIAIGGLLNEQDTVNMQKIPGLGDLPLLGKFFTNKSKTKTRTELMVFITSRIVKD